VDDAVPDPFLPVFILVDGEGNSAFYIDLPSGTRSEPIVFSRPPERLDFSVYERKVVVTLPSNILAGADTDIWG
jgi:hypothetical protein